MVGTRSKNKGKGRHFSLGSVKEINELQKKKPSRQTLQVPTKDRTKDKKTTVEDETMGISCYEDEAMETNTNNDDDEAMETNINNDEAMDDTFPEHQLDIREGCHHMDDGLHGFSLSQEKFLSQDYPAPGLNAASKEQYPDAPAGDSVSGNFNDGATNDSGTGIDDGNNDALNFNNDLGINGNINNDAGATNDSGTGINDGGTNDGANKDTSTKEGAANRDLIPVEVPEIPNNDTRLETLLLDPEKEMTKMIKNRIPLGIKLTQYLTEYVLHGIIPATLGTHTQVHKTNAQFTENVIAMMMYIFATGRFGRPVPVVAKRTGNIQELIQRNSYAKQLIMFFMVNYIIPVYNRLLELGLCKEVFGSKNSDVNKLADSAATKILNTWLDRNKAKMSAGIYSVSFIKGGVMCTENEVDDDEDEEGGEKGGHRKKKKGQEVDDDEDEEGGEKGGHSEKKKEQEVDDEKKKASQQEVDDEKKKASRLYIGRFMTLYRLFLDDFCTEKEYDDQKESYEKVKDRSI